MKIRLRLALAFFLLAVVPLTGLVLYSYYASLKAVRQSTEEEAIATAVELERRMAEVRGDLASRFERLAMVPAEPMLSAEGDAPTEGGGDLGPQGRQAVGNFLNHIVNLLGEDAGLVESLQVIPLPPTPAPAPPEPPAATSEPEGRRLDVAALPKAERPPADGASPPSANPGAKSPLQVEGELTFDLEDLEGGEALGQWVQTLTAGAQVLQALGALDASTAGEVDLGNTPLSYRLERVESPDTEGRWRAFISTGEGGTSEDKPGEPEIVATAPGEPLRAARQRSLEQAARRRAALAQRRASQQGTAAPPAESFESEFFGQPIAIPLRQGDHIMARVRPEIRADALLRRVLAFSDRTRGEVPFALGQDGHLYVAEDADRSILEQLDLTTLDSPNVQHIDDQPWVVTALEEADGQFTFGIARPLGGPMAEIRRTASRNFLYGIGLIGLALFGIVPLSRRITSDLHTVSLGAERIAAGDLEARVEVRSADEIGQLAHTFNSMAQQLSEHESRRREDERRRRDEALQRQILQADVDRKTRELEEARQFQLSLLPKSLPEHTAFDLAVEIRTATEVGGDYYDYRQEGDLLTVAIGDATGHGARAGTMVTVTKSLFSAYHGTTSPSGFLQEAAQTVRRMDLGRMSMALSIAELRPDRLVLAAAGMPPALLYRAADGIVEELALPGMPLGSRLTTTYQQADVPLGPGDTLLLTSDGVPELLAAGPDGPQRDVFGYERLRRVFADAAGQSAADIRTAICQAMDRWCGEGTPNDDITLLVIQRRRFS